MYQQSISKCERTKRNLDNELAQICRLKQSTESKMSTNMKRLQDLQSELNHFGQDSRQPSKVTQELIEQNDAKVSEDLVCEFMFCNV